MNIYAVFLHGHSQARIDIATSEIQGNGKRGNTIHRVSQSIISKFQEMLNMCHFLKYFLFE